MPEEEARHRCDGCAFLALRRKGDLAVIEAAPGFRLTPRDTEDYYVRPICIMGRRDFSADFRDVDRMYAAAQTPNRSGTPVGAAERAGAVVSTLITIDRPCNDFEKYIEGVGPREHREMLDRKWRLEREQEWRAADRAVQKDIARISVDVATASKDSAVAAQSAARSQKHAVWVAAIAIVISVIASCWRDAPTNVTNIYEATPQSTPRTSGETR